MLKTTSPRQTVRVPHTRRIAPPPVTRSLSILIADDDPWMLELMKRHLRMLNHLVASTRDGKEAVALARTFKPDVVILDIHMPGFDGIQAAREIQASRDVAVIFSTGAADEKTLARVQKLRVGAYLVKPFSPAQLKAAIFVAVSSLRREADESSKVA